MRRSAGKNAVIKVLRPLDRLILCVRTSREVKLLRYFNHPNIISILGIEKPRDYDSFTEIYLVQEQMDTDLHKIIRTRELSNEYCLYFIWQILRALKAMHSAGVLHCDLKPSNLLLNDNCDLKVYDLSLARSAASVEAEQGSMTEYVTSRWYRAPEIMLAIRQNHRFLVCRLHFGRDVKPQAALPWQRLPASAYSDLRRAWNTNRRRQRMN
jgi:mitogen-activated protein kinase 1/3